MPPALFMGVLIILTAGAWLVDLMSRRRRAAALEGLAREWGMNFLAQDRFDLIPIAAGRLPTPGAASVRVRDLIYTQEQGAFRCIFTIEYTVGIVGPHERRVSVGMLCEPCPRSSDSKYSAMLLAPEDLAWIERYRWLWNQFRHAVASKELPQ